MEKVCLFCKHYYFIAGGPGYSDATPGCEANEGCSADHWETDMMEDTEAIRRANFLRAETCSDIIEIET